MFENIGYQFENLEEVIMFVEWLTTHFETPEEFEKFLLEKMPYLLDADESVLSVTTIDPVSLMDDDLEGTEDSIVTNFKFWNIIGNEYDDGGTSDTTISGSD